MPALQTIYNTYPVAGFEGGRVNLEEFNTISRTVETAAGIAFGRAVVQGAGDHGIILPATAVGSATSAAKSGGNTGNGTFVLDGSTPVLANAESGVYQLRAIAAGTNSATFRLYDPRGRTLRDYAFSGSGAAVTTDDQIKGVLTDGSTDFIVGDGFDVTVSVAGGAKFVGVTVLDQAVGAYNPLASPSFVPNLYPQYATAGVMDFGVIWVAPSAPVNARDPAFFVPATGIFTNVAAGNIAVPRGYFDSTAASGALAKLRIR